MPRIHYSPDEQEIQTKPEENILEASLRASIPHTHACGGKAKCSTCRVLILKGLEHLPPRNAKEQAIARRMGFNPSIRLACQTVPGGDVSVRRLILDHEDVELIKESSKEKTLGSLGEEKKIAILFADIRNFTSLAEALSPYDVIHLLNRYFHQMGLAIERNGGCIDNFIGDGLMAVFGVKDPMAAALRAVRAGLQMLEAAEKLKPYVKSMYGKDFRIGIGVHYGSAVVGTVGVPNNRKTTVIGDAVNFASRIEAANKKAGTQFLISEDTQAEIQDQVLTKSCCTRVTIPGKSGEYTLYEVTGLA